MLVVVIVGGDDVLTRSLYLFQEGEISEHFLLFSGLMKNVCLCEYWRNNRFFFLGYYKTILEYYLMIFPYEFLRKQ